MNAGTLERNYGVRTIFYAVPRVIVINIKRIYFFFSSPNTECNYRFVTKNKRCIALQLFVFNVEIGVKAEERALLIHDK